ncbi:class F sortase [Mycobacterium sp. NBC_00419]|uniref:class F sortase n=1 Tax=Mycobacterium sp. NBC_00419 TaxID=2975989 RepID=UPI002E1D2AFF
MTRRAAAAAITIVSIALASPGAAWAQPVSDNASVMVMPLPASPPPVEGAAFVPAQLDIPSIAVTAVVAPVGTVMAPAPFLGGEMVPTFAVPPDGSTVGWWADGPMVGISGMSIILGHNKIGGYAVFNRLGELHAGDDVTLSDGTGNARADFHITGVVAGVPKGDHDALRRVLSENADSAQLALITCGGDFDPSYRASADNVVAFAARS